MKQSIYYILYFFGIGLSLNAQSSDYTEVYTVLKAKDSLLFERSFNNCESQYLDVLISEDFEFYHDQSGITNSKPAFIKIMKDGICDPNNKTKSRRELFGKLEVFPLYNNGKLYGALQNGVHRFFETRDENTVAGSTARFSHLWMFENNQWKLKRVISYDHQMK